jgi:hypothetical protein
MDARFVDFGEDTLLPYKRDMVERIDGQSSDDLRTLVRHHVPRVPGVYGMIDALGRLVYVGKSKSLRGSSSRTNLRRSCASNISSEIGNRVLMFKVCPNASDQFTSASVDRQRNTYTLRESSIRRHWCASVHFTEPHGQRMRWRCLTECSNCEIAATKLALDSRTN